MATFKAALILLVLPLVTAGCTSIGPGDKPSPTPPHLLKNTAKVHYWNDAGLFGKITPELQSEGNARCASLGEGDAIGYHPHAKKADGTYFEGNAYLCSLFD